MSLNRVQEILSVALYRLDRSGNGGGERDAALQCGCSVGSIVAYTNCTVAGLLKLNNEVMQFALEEEREHAAAWVHNTTGVEEWGKGWLVVDGTHIPLAWKPGVRSQEHFCYKGFLSRTGPAVGNNDEGEIERRGREDYQTSGGVDERVD